MYFLLFLLAQDTLIRWEPEVNLTQDTLYNLAPWIASQGDYVHVAWVLLDKSVFYQRSIDNGVTWSEPYKLSDTISTVIFPKIALKDSFVHVVWTDKAGGEPYVYRVCYKRSSDNGQSWSNLMILGPSGSRKGIVCVGDTVVVLASMTDTTIWFYITKSYDNGVTWTPYHSIMDRFPDYDIGLDYFDGRLHLAFIDDADSVYYMSSTDLGETWSEPLQIAVNPQLPKCRNIVANDYGHLFITWSDNKYSPGWLNDILLRRSTDNGFTWLPEQQITTHHLVNLWDDICCADSDVYIVWPKGGALDALQFRASTDMGETWWPIEDICNNLVFDGSIAANFPKIHTVWRDRRAFPSEIYYRRGTRLPVGIKETRGRQDNETRRPELEVYPNPFSTMTKISVGIAQSAEAEGINPLSTTALGLSLRIYDATGRLIKDFSRFTNYDLRSTIIVWQGDDDLGRRVPAGVYFVRLKTGDFGEIKKVVKIR